MDQQQMHVHTDQVTGYAMSGKIMLSATLILFVVVVFMVGLHLYVRWYLVRRRQQRRTHVVTYADNNTSTSSDSGLEAAVLNSLPVYLYSSEKSLLECAVCLSEFQEKEIVRLLPKCNHSFHIGCIDMWFHSHSTCPLCRSPVEPVVTEPLGIELSVSTTNTGLDSGSDLCATCQHHEGGRMKGMEVVGVTLPSELTQSSRTSRMLSLKRILSIGRKSPVGGPAGLDLESGLGQSNLVQIPS